MKINALRVFGCAALIAVGASAWAEEVADPFTIEPDGICGIVKYDGDANSEGSVERIVAVPWVDRDANGNLCDMPVEKIITPSDLTVGDQLHIWNGEKYDIYEWDGEKWTGAKDGDSGESPNPSTTKVKRGQALWYVRKAPEGDFTLMGTVGGESCQSKVAAKTKSLFVNPYPRDINILAKISGETFNGDRIVPLKDETKPYQKKGGKWGMVTPGGIITTIGSLVIYDDDVFTETPTIEIPANQAFWYISKGGSPTINW